MKGILKEYGLHSMGIAENGFRQLNNPFLQRPSWIDHCVKPVSYTHLLPPSAQVLVSVGEHAKFQVCSSHPRSL